MITVGFSPHYLETLPYAKEQMESHQSIVLEEPRSPDFKGMLHGDLEIDDYIRTLDSAFPEFDRRMCTILRELHLKGKQIIQVEPYLDGLLRIHDLFGHGKKPRDILRMPRLGAIYSTEKDATAALLEYYAAAAKQPFDTVIGKVRKFARADARRLILRASMRAEAVAGLTCQGPIYVEAGNIHYPFYRQLRRKLNSNIKLRVVFLMNHVLKAMHAKRRNLDPGDVLTLLYALHGDISDRTANLLTARSLIYIKLISKSELEPGSSKHPQSEEEVRINRLVDRLDYQDCRELFDRNRTLDRENFLRLVEDRVKKR